MQCYTELIPPTGITHAVSLPFLGPEANNLVVAKTSLLQVFEVKASSNDGSKLSLIGEYPLAGTVTALNSITTTPASKTGGHTLLIAFKDAKLSLVEWDPESHRISTVSIHYYEGDNIILPPYGPKLSECESILTVDPQSGCAALKFGQRHLAILPFRGDEVAEEGGDEDMDAEPAPLRSTSTIQMQDGADGKKTPYKASFALPLTTLDPTLTHPVDLAFLHEYREPTFGILSSTYQPSQALLEERKDGLTYTVFTLDLEQRASTNLITVSKLPSDLWKVIPLPLPVGGCLLVGTNEFVHIDQSGKANAVAINEFATKASGFSMADQSALEMKLEGCEIESLDPRTGDLLVVLNDGKFAVLSFKVVGRNVSGLTVTRIPQGRGGSANASAPSCVTALDGQQLFIGSEDGDSSLISWSKDNAQLSRKRSHAQMLGKDSPAEDADEAEDMDEDDLYAPSAEAVKRITSIIQQSAVDAASTYSFKKIDELRSLGPINNVCLGRSPQAGKDKLELVAACGKGRSSKLAFLNREIMPQEVRSRQLEQAKGVWHVAYRSEANAEEEQELLFVYDGETTKAYTTTVEGELEEKTDTDFESEGETMYVGTLASGTTIVQVRPSEVRTYDHELGLSQIIPQVDEESDLEFKVVATSFCDPYLLVLRDDSTVQILKAEKGEIEPLESPDGFAQRKWLSGYLYAGAISDGQAAAWLLDEEGGLKVFSLPELKEVYATPTLPTLPPVLALDTPQRRGAKVTLTELLVADLGTEEVKQPYLIVRSSIDDLTFYEPFHYTPATASAEDRGWESLRWRKVPNTYVPKFDETLDTAESARPSPLQAVKAGARHVVYVPGSQPSFILKEAASLPKVLGIRAKKVRGFTPSSQHGFALLDSEGKMSEYGFPHDASYETGWSVRTFPYGEPSEEVRHVAFHEQRGVYVVTTCRDRGFVLVDEEGRAVDEDDTSLKPQIPQYTIHLLSATTHELIQSFGMPYPETITSLKVMPLEVSEHTHEQKPMVVVGTATMRGEDMPAKGHLTVFDIIDVVPEPERPESGIKLQVFAREETKGHITALESFPGGLIGTAQGMKIMIRGLKEDGSCLPVAFLDAQCYTHTLKTLGNSGLWMAGDAWKGLWFGGWTQEPYKLSVLGKSRAQMEIMAAEFLPFDGQMFVVIVDADSDLHVLQYDPENPKSDGGSRLLHRGTFYLGHLATSMMLVPSELAPFAQQEGLQNGHAEDSEMDGEAQMSNAPSLFHILTTSHSGSIGLLTPLDENTYRRLGTVHTQLTNVLEHAAGLNPRAYRAVDSEGLAGRGIIDGGVVQRVSELGAIRRAEVLGRAGSDGWGLRSDLEIIGGGGLGYL